MNERCVSCHAAAPTQAGFAAPPKGVVLDTPEQIVAQAVPIQQQTATQSHAHRQPDRMTDAERALIAEWVARGAPRQ